MVDARAERLSPFSFLSLFTRLQHRSSPVRLVCCKFRTLRTPIGTHPTHVRIVYLVCLEDDGAPVAV
jgi:hypothetical protein